MEINLIAACDEERGIGRGGGIPWHIPTDFLRFKTLTQGHAVLMGTGTWKSLPKKPLMSRTNIICTSQMTPEGSVILDSVVVVGSISSAIAAAKELGHEKLWLIGGERIYKEAIYLCKVLYITEIRGIFGCDVFLPEYQGRKCIKASNWMTDNGVSFRFTEWI